MIPLHARVQLRRFPFWTLAIIAANVWIFAGWQERVGLRASVLAAGLAPAELTGPEPSVSGIGHLFTHMFLHGGWLHLLGNMWFLWVFGRGVEEATGGLRFLAFYLVSGVTAAICHVSFSPGSPVPLVGASGAISGVLGAYFMLYPRSRIVTAIPIIIILKIVEAPAWVFLLIWVGIQALAQSVVPAHQTAGVAYLAHLGGFAAGMILIFSFGVAARPPRTGNRSTVEIRPSWPGRDERPARPIIRLSLPLVVAAAQKAETRNKWDERDAHPYLLYDQRVSATAFGNASAGSQRRSSRSRSSCFTGLLM